MTLASNDASPDSGPARPEPGELHRHLRSIAAFERLSDLVAGWRRPLDAATAAGDLSPVAKAGHAKAIIDFLTAYGILRRRGHRLEVSQERFSQLMPFLRESRPGAASQPAVLLATVPPDAGFDPNPQLLPIETGIDLVLSKASETVYVLNPFFDAAGSAEFRRLVGRLSASGPKLVLVTRIYPFRTPSNNELLSLLRHFESDGTASLRLCNYHFQEASEKFHRLSFHAKGVYAKDAAVLATMNYVGANLTRNIEFGILLRGAPARLFYDLAEQMARAAGVKTLAQAIAVLDGVGLAPQ